jgi:hypothetical protein
MKVTVELDLHPKILEALVHQHGGLDIGMIAVMALNSRAAQLGILDAILAEDNASLDVVPPPAAARGGDL